MSLREEIKALIIEALMIEDMEASEIQDEQELFGGELELDSVDALEIAVEIERVYGVRIPDAEEGREVFRNVKNLAAYVQAHRK